MIYAPGGRRPDEQALYKRTMDWASDRLARLPMKCIPLVFTDANTKLGSIDVENELGLMLIGGEGGQQESGSSPCLRESMVTYNLCDNMGVGERAAVEWQWV